MIHILFIDDHPLLSQAIGAWLCGKGGFTIAGSAVNLTEARSLMERLENPPDIVVLDISLGKEDGLAVIPEIREICAKRNAPFPGILVYTMHEDPFLIQRAFDLGAAAYVPKSAESEEILAAIDALLSGSTYVNAKYQIQNRHTFAFLSPREKDIITLLKQSLDNRQIAERLGLSVRTVENHLARIYDKTGVASRKELFNL
jgi:NarL family two-component system response regulator LiaR